MIRHPEQSQSQVKTGSGANGLINKVHEQTFPKQKWKITKAGGETILGWAHGRLTWLETQKWHASNHMQHRSVWWSLCFAHRHSWGFSVEDILDATNYIRSFKWTDTRNPLRVEATGLRWTLLGVNAEVESHFSIPWLAGIITLPRNYYNNLIILCLLPSLHLEFAGQPPWLTGFQHVLSVLFFAPIARAAGQNTLVNWGMGWGYGSEKQNWVLAHSYSPSVLCCLLPIHFPDVTLLVWIARVCSAVVFLS